MRVDLTVEMLADEMAAWSVVNSADWTAARKAEMWVAESVDWKVEWTAAK